MKIYDFEPILIITYQRILLLLKMKKLTRRPDQVQELAVLGATLV
jgi:hypothetical protein